jgi:homoserine kinase type II
MAKLTALSLADAARLGREFGLEIVEVEGLEAGSVNSNFRMTTSDGRVYFGRLNEEQDASGAERELELLRALARAGVEVAEPLRRSAGGFLSEHAGKPFAVFPWVAGVSRCKKLVGAEHCKKIGAALARVHMSGFDARRLGPGRFQPSDMLARLDRVEREGARPDLLPDVARVRELYARYVPGRDATLPHGVVHGDLFRDNVLWSGDEIAALLDFESVFHGPLAYDLAVTILSWCYGDAFEPELMTAMASGYREVRRFEPNELRSFPREAALACLRFATSRITDFSLRTLPGERPARDFHRFLDRLEAVENGALEPTLEVLSR